MPAEPPDVLIDKTAASRRVRTLSREIGFALALTLAAAGCLFANAQIDQSMTASVTVSTPQISPPLAASAQ